MNESNRPGSRRPGATPNRGGNRTPPLIEGEARDVTADGPPAGEPAEQEAQSIAAGPLPGHESEVHGTPDGKPGATAGATPKDAAAAEGALPADATAGEPIAPALDTEAGPDAGGPSGPAGPASTPSDRSAGPGRALPIAAIVVSLLALAAAAYPLLRETTGQDNSAALAEARQRLDAQDAKLAAQDKALHALASLDDRLKALESATKSQGAALDGLRADTKKALDTANAARGDARQASAAAAALPAASAQGTAPAAPPVDLGPIQARLGDLDTRLKQTADAVAKNSDSIAKNSDAISKAGDAIAKARDAAQQARAGLAPLAPLPGAVAALDQRLGADEQKLQALASQPKVDAAALEKRTGTAVAAADSAARVVMAKALVQAIDAGRPYKPELAALAASGADQSRLGPLEAHAASGVPTAPALADSFSGLAGSILAGTDTSKDGSLWDRLARGAGKLVRIRPVGEASGDDPPSIVARMEAALARGDVAGALAAREHLPEKAKAATEAWAKDARARVEALAAADGLVNEATERLARPRS